MKDRGFAAVWPWEYSMRFEVLTAVSANNSVQHLIQKHHVNKPEEQ
jgi:hypothetical protein